MAFNLNKNEATDSATKFDLSKSNSPATVDTQQEKSKSTNWVFALIGLLMIGIAAWFFLSKSDTGSNNENVIASITASEQDSTITPSGNQNGADATTIDTMKQAPPENAGASNTSATAGSNTATDTGSSNNNPDRTSAAAFNNSVPVTFAKGSASISSLDQRLVKELIVFLQKNPAAAINVNGYASSEGELTVNQKISQSRADAFKSYLVSKGITGNRISSTGKGIDNPISPNDTEEGRIKNRRIEISIQ